MSLIAALDVSAGVRDPAALCVLESDGIRHTVTALHRWMPDGVLGCARDTVAFLDRYRPASFCFDSQGIGREFRTLAQAGNLVNLVPTFPVIPGWTNKPPRQSPADGAILASKSRMASGLMAVIRSGRFKCPPHVVLGQTLKSEIGSFDTWTDPSGFLKCGARPGCHDDLFWAVAMAVMLGETTLRHGQLNRWTPLRRL